MEESIAYLRNPTELSPSPGKLRRCGLVDVRKCDGLDQCRKKIESDFERENAVVGGDSEFEIQEIGEGWEATTRRAKRTRCIYSNVLEKPVHPESLELLRVTARASSKSTEWDSSASNSEDPDTDRASEPSRKRSKLIRELKSNDNQQTFDVDDPNKDVISRETGEYLDLVAEKLHQTSFGGHYVYMGKQDVMDIVLVDVQLNVDTSPRARNAAFVSLRSEAYGIAVIGYPLDVGKMRDSPSEGGGIRFDQLVWPTSKRTPVCYVSSSLPASICKNASSSAKKGKLQKSRKQGKAAVRKTCVPVELVFGKILAAVD